MLCRNCRDNSNGGGRAFRIGSGYSRRGTSHRMPPVSRGSVGGRNPSLDRASNGALRRRVCEGAVETGPRSRGFVPFPEVAPYIFGTLYGQQPRSLTALR